jgi:OPA family glycerol-3-phosphate transporter-like MFS transporter
MAGAIFFSVFFGQSGTVPLFTLAWMGNRLLQSMGWTSIAKITSRWFSFSTYGAVMGFISLSYLFGDFLSRQLLSQLIAWHLGWRQVFFAAAGVLASIFLVTVLLLKESPQAVGAEEPPANPDNLFGVEGNSARPLGLADLLLPLLRSPRFWLVCVLSFGFTVLRETFNDWTPTYLTEVGHMSVADAGKASSYFPLFGGISVLFCGWLSDRLGRAGRAAIIFCGLAMVIPALYALSAIKPGSQLTAILMLGGIGFVTLGPYAFLAGALSLDFGGKKGSATAAGWIDGIGYIGGSLIAGKTIGKIAETQGWRPAFLLLTMIAIGSSVAAGLYWLLQARPRQAPSAQR